MATKVLVVDDDLHVLRALKDLLSAEGYETTTAATAEEALDACRHHTFHLAVTDLQMPGRSGIALINTLREACPETKTVLITAHGSVRTAVTAIKRGAAEYIAKPIKPRRFLSLVQALTAQPPIYLTNRLLDSTRLDVVTEGGMVARSTAMREVFDRIRTAAGSDSPVLIAGESGTGKELVARAIHGRSAQASGPFVSVHTGAIPPELIAAELFGDQPGERLGKFSAARGGTLFLDEIAAMDEKTQLHLLRALEALKGDPPARVRVIAASSRDLGRLVESGQFREDLYFRLNIVSIPLAPLRERPEDVPALAHAFLEEHARRYGKPVTALAPETLRLLQAYNWPGNVRELRNVIEQGVLLSQGAVLEARTLPHAMHQPVRQEFIKIPIGTAMDQVEREVILRTLEAKDGNKTATAEVLGISRRSIYNKLALYGIPTGERA